MVAHILDGTSGELENLFQRCKSLSWIFYNRRAEVDLAARTLASASLPALEHLTIQGLFVFNDDPMTRLRRLLRLPRLKEVTLINHSETCTPPFFHDDDFARVERLTFTNTSRWMDYDIICIHRFRSIRSLMLKDAGYFKAQPYGETQSDLVEPAELPLLETLTLSGDIPHQVLNLIRTPGLRKMEIEADTARGWHSLVAINLIHMVRSLERLYVNLREGMHVTYWVEELERLVAEASFLVSMCISPWMAQHLKGEEWCNRLHITDSS